MHYECDIINFDHTVEFWLWLAGDIKLEGKSPFFWFVGLRKVEGLITAGCCPGIPSRGTLIGLNL